MKREAETEICPRLGLPHQHWPQGNCQYCGAPKPEATEGGAHEKGIEAAVEMYLIPHPVNLWEGAALEDMKAGMANAIAAYLQYSGLVLCDAKPVAWTIQAQLDGIKGNGNNAVMWGEPLPHHPDIPLYSTPTETDGGNV